MHDTTTVAAPPPGKPILALALGLLVMLVLAGCAGTPQFTELQARVIPPDPLTLSDDAELNVRLSDADGTLAETTLTHLGTPPWAVSLRHDSQALEDSRSPRLSAELRQRGELTHATSEPVLLEESHPDEPVTLSLDPRR
ncbi:YbaY family lipoprotein [Halomonas sp. M5N1S17]|uniref:YbaY family lipoprotein n=1 Tax=Halomonas alkalisoli TaxID=2907158 RepID=UPI001F26DF99|nr:YbaY family lipoprotein [Halomonas alkalisoli]MCE9662888.1 YbaY family lipoprotein [Halomonas alkalisoli]